MIIKKRNNRIFVRFVKVFNHFIIRPISILFQDYNLFSHLNIIENVAIGLTPNLKMNSIQSEIVDSVINEVGLSKFKFKKPSQLSGGQMTRVSLARAMVRSKPILLLVDLLKVYRFGKISHFVGDCKP